jgi:ABC-type antimicrobial peptide transport system permease subunit
MTINLTTIILLAVIIGVSLIFGAFSRWRNREQWLPETQGRNVIVGSYRFSARNKDFRSTPSEGKHSIVKWWKSFRRAIQESADSALGGAILGFILGIPVGIILTIVSGFWYAWPGFALSITDVLWGAVEGMVWGTIVGMLWGAIWGALIW